MYAPIPSEGSTKGTIYASDNHCSAPYVLTVRDACIDHGPAYGPSGRTDTWHILRARGPLNTRANVRTSVVNLERCLMLCQILERRFVSYNCGLR